MLLLFHIMYLMSLAEPINSAILLSVCSFALFSATLALALAPAGVPYI